MANAKRSLLPAHCVLPMTLNPKPQSRMRRVDGDADARLNALRHFLLPDTLAVLGCGVWGSGIRDYGYGQPCPNPLNYKTSTLMPKPYDLNP